MNSFIFNSRWWCVLLFLLVFGGFSAVLFSSEWLVRRHVIPNDLFQKHLAHYQRETSTINAVFGDSIGAHNFIGSEGFQNWSYLAETPTKLLIKAQGKFNEKNAGNIVLEASLTLLTRLPKPVKEYETLFLKSARPRVHVFSLYHRARLQRYWKVFLTGQSFAGRYIYFPNGGVKVKTSHTYDNSAIEIEALRLGRTIPDINVVFNRGEYIKLLEYLVSRGANVCIVEWPVHPAFATATAKIERFSTSRKFFRELAEAKKLRYQSYWDLLGEAGFIDGYHLTYKAALEFSRKVVADCFS